LVEVQDVSEEPAASIVRLHE